MGGLLEVTFTCTRMLENMAAFSTSAGNLFLYFYVYVVAEAELEMQPLNN